MKPLIYTLALVATGLALSPMLCQKEKGMRVFRRDYKLKCTTDTTPKEIQAKLRVPSYKQQTAGGHWSGLYQQTCVTHYFFWGSYTSKAWHEPQELTKQQKADLVRGVCPSNTHPTPLLHHIDDNCIYSWPTETETKTLYCITRATTIRQIVGQPLTSDEEALIPASIIPGQAETVTGAVVTWNEADIHELDAWETRYEGPAYIVNNQVIIESLQEGFLLVGQPHDDDLHWSTWTTVEGFQINVPRISLLTRKRRVEYAAIQAEVNAKLQYTSTRIESALQLTHAICNRQNQLRDSLETAITRDADKYAHSLFNTTYITATATEGHLFVWPCKPVDNWHIYHTTQAGLCPVDLPIKYTQLTTQVGYVNVITGKIVNTTNWIDCQSLQPTPYEHNGTLYLRTRLGIVNITAGEVKGLPHIGHHGHIAPLWLNHWIYKDTDFHHDEPRYLTMRDIEMREKVTTAEGENAKYNQYMQMPFVGLPMLPSLTRMLELTAQLGGYP